MLQRRIERLEKRTVDGGGSPFFVIIFESDATDEEIKAIVDEARRARRVGVAIDQEVVDAYREKGKGGKHATATA